MIKILKTILVDGLKSPLSNGHCIDENSNLGRQVLSKYKSLVSSSPENISERDVACLFDPEKWDKTEVRYWSKESERTLQIVEVSYNMATGDARSGNQRKRMAEPKPMPKVVEPVEEPPVPAVEAVEPVVESAAEAVEPVVESAVADDIQDENSDVAVTEVKPSRRRKS
jgi:hypothetical protein